MRLFIGEFITGGGLCGQPLPAQLAREGELMLQSLLADCRKLPDCHVTVARDSRLEGFPESVHTLTIAGNYRESWCQALHACDAAIIIAPETDRVLYDLTVLASGSGCRLPGSHPEAVLLCTSKRHTLGHLEQSGIPVVPLLETDTADYPVVIKPDDGVGAEDCRLLESPDELADYQREFGDTGICQPWIPGTAASLSLLCYGGACHVIAVNEQQVTLNNGRFLLERIIVNGIPYDNNYQQLADAVIKAVPGLAGYVGIDLILTPDGPKVLEINPRLTTAYAGLGSSLPFNPAEWLLALPNPEKIPPLDAIQYQPVTVRLEQS